MRRLIPAFALLGLAGLPAGAAPSASATGAGTWHAPGRQPGLQLVWWRAAGVGPRGGAWAAGGMGAWHGRSYGYVHGWAHAPYYHGYGYARPVAVAPWYHPAATVAAAATAGAVAGSLAGAAAANDAAQAAPKPPGPTTVINNYYD